MCEPSSANRAALPFSVALILALPLAGVSCNKSEMKAAGSAVRAAAIIANQHERQKRNSGDVMPEILRKQQERDRDAQRAREIVDSLPK